MLPDVPRGWTPTVVRSREQDQLARRLEDIGFAGGFDPADAVQLTWQNLIPSADGTRPVELRPQDIDTLIRVAGQGA